VDRGHLGVEVDLVVDGNPEQRPRLRRGRRADDGVDLGEEPGGRRAQRDRRGGPVIPAVPVEPSAAPVPDFR